MSFVTFLVKTNKPGVCGGAEILGAERSATGNDIQKFGIKISFGIAEGAGAIGRVPNVLI